MGRREGDCSRKCGSKTDVQRNADAWARTLSDVML